jgi:cytochrome c oxidase subunit 2
MALLFISSSASAETREGDPPPQDAIRVIARKFSFEPKTITVRKGQKVRLAVTSADVDHGIAISEFNVDVNVPAKQTKMVPRR